MLDDLFRQRFDVPELDGKPIPKPEPVARPIDDPITRAATLKAREQRTRYGYQYKLGIKMKKRFID